MNAPIRAAFDCSSRKPMRRHFVSGFPRALLSLSQEKSSGVEIAIRLESLTICGCNYIGRTYSVILIKTLSVGPAGVELTTSHMAARCLTIHSYYMEMDRRLDKFLCFMFLFPGLAQTMRTSHPFSKRQSIENFH